MIGAEAQVLCKRAIITERPTLRARLSASMPRRFAAKHPLSGAFTRG